MLLLKILEYDLHGSREGEVPFFFGVAARKEHLPAIVTNLSGKFVVIRHIGASPGLKRSFPKVSWDDRSIYKLTFPWDSDRMDDLIPAMMDAAYGLSRDEEWKNVFTGESAASSAFDYVDNQVPTAMQPHACIIPSTWDSGKVNKFFGKKNLSSKKKRYRERCHIFPAKVAMPVFLSRPEYVGMYTQYMGGGRSAVILHNVRRGMAFCPLGKN